MNNSQQHDVDMKKSNMLVQYFNLNIFQGERGFNAIVKIIPDVFLQLLYPAF